MSSEEVRVSLRLKTEQQTGQLFRGVLVEDRNCTLADFLDLTLKALESQSLLQLPDTDELINPQEFKVFDEQMTQELDLNLQMSQQPYVINGQMTGASPPVLVLQSEIFMSACQVEREEHVKRAKKRQSGTEGEPEIPPRDSSLTANVMSKDDILYLAGRKEYDPACKRLKHGPSNISLASSLNGGPSPIISEDMADKIFDAASSDSSSNLSFSSSATDGGSKERVERRLSQRSGLSGRKPSAASDSSQPSPTMQGNISDLSQQSGPGEESNLAGSDLTLTNEGPSSMPTSPDFMSGEGGMDFNQERARSPESESGRHKRTARSESYGEVNVRPIITKSRIKVAKSLPLEELIIEEPEGEDREERGSERGSVGPEEEGKLRSPSPSLLAPSSPQRVVSPTQSPRGRRKTRMATRRRFSRLEGESMEKEGGSQPWKERETFMRKRTIYDKSRRSTALSSYFPNNAKIFTNIKTFSIIFDIPIVDLSVEMEIQGDYTVGQIKDNLWSLLREEGLLGEEVGGLSDPEKFTFTYKMREETYELYDEQQIFQTAAVVQLWRKERREKGLLVVEQKKAESKEEKTMNMEMSAMIGIGLYQLQFANNDELDITRRKMVAVRRHAVRSRDTREYCMERSITFQAIPRSVTESLIDDHGLLRVYYKAGLYQTFQTDVYNTADHLIPQVIPDNVTKRQRFGLPEKLNPDDYVLKVAGQESYIYGHYELIQFTYIIHCLSKRQDIELALVKALNPEEDLCRDIPDWNLIDSSTGLTGTHTELSALSKEHTQVFTMSMWDLQRKFRVRVVGLDNFRNTDIDVVYIEAGVYHGGELLGSSKFTTESLPTAYPRWSQWLTFDMAVKMLPKAARLCFQVVGGIRTRDTRKKSLRKSMSKSDEKKGDMVDQPLHWVNMQILDHRALLRQGLLRLNLWPIASDGSSGSATPSPMGSTAVNPDGNTSVALYIELDSYLHPVACPTGGWGEDMGSLPENEPRGEFKRELDTIIHADPLTPLTKPMKELLWSCRNYCRKVPEALPKLLRSINWADLTQVCEVHRLLRLWRPITLEVALELLDYHFADDKIRSLAVERLEKLSTEELLVFLLQLMQVLKFESYHDSALARFLLKRALQSKRIGHFFYWYLRSEMDTPEFNQRFGVLLEAYLRGCGEAMFKELQGQHKAVCDIMSVASSLKRHMEKHKGVAEFARAELAKYELPKSFSPPFNPIVRMGNLNLTKCKVMDSKKSPLWLEFENMDPTASGGKPIKVIAKHGDDLRQDMLTLQMLTLMDKLWQSQGLDLYIIPYGCIATGNMMGMIEVVQEAETVAKIQQKHGGSFSALREEPLHDWLRQFNLTKNRWEAAVERFTLSCAGYCVATYVLGIGDRHNDNIMVTTSGNLFHIDFGHFLGNKKEFLGVNRERAPFVLTPDFEYVMGKKGSDVFKKFEETAVRAYMIIRQNANLFINLFSMMKCTGIPELRSVEDIEYLRGVLVLGKTEAEAKEHFRSQIQSCLKLSWRTQLNFLTHNLAHSRS